MDIRNRRGEGSTSMVAIVAIIVLVLIAAYFLFFRGSSTTPEEVTPTDTINVTVPTGTEGGDAASTGAAAGAVVNDPLPPTSAPVPAQ